MNVLTNAFVSGSFNQAIFWDSEGLKIIDGADEPRLPRKNEVKLFFDCVSSVKLLDHEADLNLEIVQQKLKCERDRFTALNGLLVGMDVNHPEELRIRWMKKAENLLSHSKELKKHVCKPFLIPVDPQDWDCHNALSLAQDNGLGEICWMYVQLSKNYVNECKECIEMAVASDSVRSSLSNRRLADSFIKEGMVGEMLYALSSENPRDALNNLVFNQSFKNKDDPNGQAFLKIIKTVLGNKKLTQLFQQNAQAKNNILDQNVSNKCLISKEFHMIEDALLWVKDQQEGQSNRIVYKDVSVINSQIDYIMGFLGKNSNTQICTKISRLIKSQFSDSKFSHIVKTVTSIATKLKQLNYLELSYELYEILVKFDVDAIVYCGHAEVLRALGRHEDALSAYVTTMERFPEAVVAYCGHAEVLRALGLHEDALSAYVTTMERFPEDVAARNGHASLNVYLCNFDEVVTALEKFVVMPKVNSDWISLHIVAMANFRKNDLMKAEKLMKRGVLSCPFPESHRIFQASLFFIKVARGEYKSAEEGLGELLKKSNLPREEGACIGIMRAHTLGHLDRVDEAGAILDNLVTIDFMSKSQKKVTDLIKERFGIGTQMSEDPYSLDKPIYDEECILIDLVIRKSMETDSTGFRFAA